ncbi:dethiobiotin synthase [Pantoea sp. 1.19]|uniref:dethiobiotin synthase n=1 Tax=Pantoea sp. 1.19 TaxID=1925589 RepID=UPI000948B3AF|nr:dethiobiotin synthase [Pantoea sp. 1.19]
MNHCYFVTGTDAEVGKTIVSLALMRKFASAGRRVAGYKPFSSGGLGKPEGLRARDALQLQAQCSADWPYEAINPLTRAEMESAPPLTQRAALPPLSAGLRQLRKASDCVIVEGCGGWRTLLDADFPLSRWAVSESLPVIMVVGIKPGCLSHALLTAEAIRADGLPLVGWVANRVNPCLPNYCAVVDALRERLAAPLLGEIPYLPRIAERDLQPYLDIVPLTRGD